jgi:hypothetical protein
MVVMSRGITIGLVAASVFSILGSPCVGDDVVPTTLADWASTASDSATAAGIGAAGWWFFMRRAHRSRARVTHELWYECLDTGQWLLHVTVKIMNLGETVISLPCLSSGATCPTVRFGLRVGQVAKGGRRDCVAVSV